PSRLRPSRPARSLRTPRARLQLLPHLPMSRLLTAAAFSLLLAPRVVRAQAALAHEAPPPVALAGPEHPSPRVQYGLEKLAAAIGDTGAPVGAAAGARQVAIGLFAD